MTTSGSVNFTQTRNELINDAFQLIGVYGIGRTVSSEDMSFANSTLNKMVKAWGAKGLHLWTKEENILFVTKDVAAYNLGNGANACNASDAVITTLTNQQDSGDTLLTVGSTTGMTVGDYIGVVLVDNSVHWTTIATIPSSTTLTLTLALTQDAPGQANIYTYTTRITKPLRILGARRVQGIDSGATSTQSEIEMAAMSYQDYMNLPSKTISGIPNQFMYNPNVDNGTLYLWQRPNSGVYRISLTCERVIQDLDSAGNNFDFPAEWLEPLTWQLALRLCPAFGKDQRMVNSIAPIAAAMLENLLDWDSEVVSVDIQPDIE